MIEDCIQSSPTCRDSPTGTGPITELQKQQSASIGDFLEHYQSPLMTKLFKPEPKSNRSRQSLESYHVPYNASAEARQKAMTRLYQRIAQAGDIVYPGELTQFEQGIRDMKEFMGIEIRGPRRA